MKKKYRSNLVLVMVDTRTKETKTIPLENLEIADNLTLWKLGEQVEALQEENEKLKAKIDEIIEAYNSLSSRVNTNYAFTKLELDELKEN